jgi:hypothetical protein
MRDTEKQVIQLDLEHQLDLETIFKYILTVFLDCF